VSETSHTHAVPAVGWLELFYDLVFVASVIVLSNSLSHEPTWRSAFTADGAFALIWWVWLATTMLVNRYRVDDAVQRALVLAQMLLITLIAVAAGNSVEDHTETVASLYGLLLLVVAGLHQRLASSGGGLTAYARNRRNGFVVAAVFFLVTGPAPDQLHGLMWGLTAVAMVVPAFGYRFGRGVGEPRLDEHHLIERVGTFTVIVLGEAFVKVGLTAADGRLDQLDSVVIGLQFVIVFSIWWAYFDDIPLAGLAGTDARDRTWLVGHLPLHLAIVGVAVGSGKFITLQPSDHAPTACIVLFVGPLAAIYLALALIGAVSPRRPLAPLLVLHLVTAAVIALVGALALILDSFAVEPARFIFGAVVLADAFVPNRLCDRTSVVRPDLPESPDLAEPVPEP